MAEDYFDFDDEDESQEEPQPKPKPKRKPRKQQGFFKGMKKFLGVEDKVEPVKKAPSTEKKLSSILTNLDEDLNVSIEDMLESGSGMAGVTLNILSLEEFKNIFADDWDSISKRICSVAETVLMTESVLLNFRHSRRTETTYILMFLDHLTLNEMEYYTAKIASEIGRKILGARFDSSDMPLLKTASLNSDEIMKGGKIDDETLSNIAKQRSVAIEPKVMEELAPIDPGKDEEKQKQIPKDWKTINRKIKSDNMDRESPHKKNKDSKEWQEVVNKGYESLDNNFKEIMVKPSEPKGMFTFSEKRGSKGDSLGDYADPNKRDVIKATVEIPSGLSVGKSALGWFKEQTDKMVNNLPWTENKEFTKEEIDAGLSFQQMHRPQVSPTDVTNEIAHMGSITDDAKSLVEAKEYTMDEWIFLTSVKDLKHSEQRDLTIACCPLWSATTEMVSAYSIAVRRRKDEDVFSGVAFYPKSSSLEYIEKVDRYQLQITSSLAKGLKRMFSTFRLICPIHYTTLQNKNIKDILKPLKDLGPEMKSQLAIEIIGLKNEDQDNWNLKKLVEVAKDVALEISVRIENVEVDLAKIYAEGVMLIGIDANGFGFLHPRKRLQELQQLAINCADNGLWVYILDADYPEEVATAVRAGFSMIAGYCLPTRQHVPGRELELDSKALLTVYL